MATNWYAQDLPTQSSGTLTIPPAVRAKLLADQLVMQQAASTDAPVYSPAVGWAKIAAGALGGYLHGKELSDIQQKQNDAWASLLGPQDAAGTSSPLPSPQASPSPTQSPSPSAAPMADAAAQSPAPSPSPPSGFTPPPMTAPQLANMIDPSKGWADPGNVPTLGAPTPGLSPGAPPPMPALPQQVAPAPPDTGQPAPQMSPAAPPTQASPMPSPQASAPPVSAAPQAPPPGFSAGVNLDPATRAAYVKVLQNPYASDQQKQMVLQRLIPPILPPEKLGPGDALVNPNNGQRIANPPTAKWSMNENGLLTNDVTGEVRTPSGQPVAGQAGQPGQTGAAGFQLNRPMTPQEKEAAGINADYPAFVNTITGKPTFGQPGMNVNVGADQDASKTVQKALFAPFKTFVGDDKTNAIEANTQSLTDLQALQAYVNHVQAVGGTTGLGTQEITKMKSLANSLAGQFGIKDQFDISDQEGLGKFARQLAVAQLATQAASSGGRMTNMALDNALKSTPGNDISLPGNQRLLGLMIQQKQRNIAIGTQIRDWAATHQQAGTQKLDPREMYSIIDGYDKTHHPTDPLTGEDLTQVQNNPAAPQPNAASGPQPIQTQQQYDALPKGATYTAPDGSVRTKQ